MKRLGIVFVALAMTVLVASPATAQTSIGDIGSFTDSLIDRTFSDVFGSPSQSQYDQTGNTDGVAGDGTAVPTGVSQDLCSNIVQNDALPTFIQTSIAEQFDLDCEPSGGSFLDSFFAGFGF